jgi:integrase
MFSTAIIFDRRGQATGAKEGALEVRITIERKSYYINTGMRVLRKHWAGAVVGRPDADALNNRLGMIIRRVNEKVNDFIEERKPIDVNVIKNFIYSGTSTKVADDGMLKWFEEQIGLLQVGKGTRKHYWLLFDRMKEFGKLRSWGDLSVEVIYEWDAWLRANVKAPVKRGEPERYIGDGTVNNYHKHLKALLHRAVDFGIISSSPYERLKGKFKKGENDNVEYLTEEQMQLIVDCHPVVGSQMETARDLFVFQMFTGLSYADTQNFDIKNYKRDGEQWVYIGKRMKTGVAYVSVLLPPVVEVLSRHNWMVPKIPNQRYNQLLKTLGSVVGIEGLHSHLARHTFATYMLSKNVKVQNVMRMMGHKKITQTMKYAKVLAKDVQEDYERIAEELRNQ